MTYLINDSSTTSKRSLWPEETRGLWVVGAWESQLKLSDNRVYDDWASGLGSNTLGYHRFTGYLDSDFHPATSLPWQIEHDFAESFCEAMGTEAVRFFKSGSDAVSCAVRLARAYTDKKLIITFDQDYHGTGDWFGPALWTRGGIVDYRHIIMLAFGKELNKTHPSILSEAAAIVVEPAPKAIIEPPTGWLNHLREVCDEHGIILISDEVILGYRHALDGYLRSAGVRADISCYGKAMAQGAALSACTGRRDILDILRDKVHFSGTNNGEPLPLHIAQATLREYLDQDICGKLNAKGMRLKLLLNSSGFKTKGLNSRFEVEGWSMEGTRFMFERGILFPGWCSMAVNHTDEQMRRLVDALVDYRSNGNG